MKAITPRPISISEAAIVCAALQRAALHPTEEFQNSVKDLAVVAICDCGCGSVFFREPSKTERRIADGVGFLPTGEKIDVSVWADGPSVTQLELVDYGQAKGVLPVPESVTSWERAGVL